VSAGLVQSLEPLSSLDQQLAASAGSPRPIQGSDGKWSERSECEGERKDHEEGRFREHDDEIEVVT